MKIKFTAYRMQFVADMEYTVTDELETEINTLEVDGKDAMFLLESSLGVAITEAADAALELMLYETSERDFIEYRKEEREARAWQQ